MPGIYINDGGAMSSGLGSALGRIAQNFTPEAQAQAQLLQQETINRMWANRRSAAEVPAEEQQIAAGRALPGLVNAEVGNYNYTPPTGPVSPVASAIASTVSPTSGGPAPAPNMAPAAPNGYPANTQQDSLSPGGEAYRGASNSYSSGSSGAQPPGQQTQGPQSRGVMSDLVAGYVARGASPSEISNLINTGQSLHAGPGRGFQEQNTIATTRAAPFALGAGQQRFDPAAPPPATMGSQPSQQQPVINQPAQQTLLSPSMQALPSGQGGQGGQGVQPAQGAPAGTQPTAAGWPASVTSGPSIYNQTVQETQGKQDAAYYGNAFTEGLKGNTDLQHIADLRALSAQMSTGTLTGRAWASVQQHLLDTYGISVGDPGAAQAEINKRIVGMVGEVKDEMGNVRMGQGAINLMLRSLPNAMMDPRVFNEVLSSAQAAAQQKVQAGEIARAELDGRINPVEARAAISSIYAHDPTASIRAQYPNLIGGPGGAGAAQPAAVGRTAVSGAPSAAAPADAAAAPAAQGGAGTAPEGTIAHTAKGDLVKRNGQWQPVQ